MKCFIAQVLLLIIVNVYLAKGVLYAGTICGWAERGSTNPIRCNEHDPRDSCPMDYTRQVMNEGVTLCYKTKTTDVGEDEYGLPGTMCGGLAANPCGGVSPSQECPKGYTRAEGQFCYKSDPNIDDASGTFCGYIFEGTGTTCNGLPRGECPKGYVGINFPMYNTYMCVRE